MTFTRFREACTSVSMTLPITSAASLLLSHSVLLAAVALCFVSKLYSIAYRLAMDSMASRLHDRFQAAVAEIEADELLYAGGGQEPYILSESGLCALQHCTVPDSDVDLGHGADVFCAVCLSELRNDDQVGQLKRCGHVFHRACIHAWLSRCPRQHASATCPLCRACLSLVHCHIVDMPSAARC